MGGAEQPDLQVTLLKCIRNFQADATFSIGPRHMNDQSFGLLTRRLVQWKWRGRFAAHNVSFRQICVTYIIHRISHDIMKLLHISQTHFDGME